MSRTLKSRSTRQVIAVCALVATMQAAMLCGSAPAQDFQRYRPLTPTNREGQPEIPDEPAPATGDPTVLVDDLKGLVFVDHKDLVTDGQLDASGIQVESDQLRLLRSRRFEEIASEHLGKPVSLLSLNQLVREIIILYRQNDQPVVDVSVPEQDITDGVVQIVVVVGRVGQVEIEGSCYFNPCMLESQTCVRPGNVIYESRLLEDLRWLNRNAFREVDLRLRPGEGYGETDIVFDVHDSRPIMVYAGYEDTGVKALGLERTIYGVALGNVLGRDHLASFQYTADSRFSRLNAVSGLYSIPTRKRNLFSVFGSYANINSDAAVPFDQGGYAWQTSARYDHELFPGYCCPRQCREHRMQLGFDFIQSNTNLDFGGVNILNTTTDIVQFMLGYTGRFDRRCRETRLGAELFYSPGDLTSRNETSDFQQVRPLARAHYFYSRAYLQHDRDLPYGLRFWGSVTGQLASGNLLPAVQMGFGGYNTVRGYDQRSVNGDSGLLVNLELRTDPLPLMNPCGRCDEFQALVFYDQGWAYNHSLVIPVDRPVDLGSLGFGFRYAIQDRLALRFDWGWQLNDLQLPFANDNNRVHVGSVLTY